MHRPLKGSPLSIEFSLSLVSGRGVSNKYSLNLVERYVIARSVIELRRPWRLVCGNRLSILNGAAIFQVGRYSGGPESVATRRIGK